VQKRKEEPAGACGALQGASRAPVSVLFVGYGYTQHFVAGWGGCSKEAKGPAFHLRLTRCASKHTTGLTASSFSISPSAASGSRQLLGAPLCNMSKFTVRTATALSTSFPSCARRHGVWIYVSGEMKPNQKFRVPASQRNGLLRSTTPPASTGPWRHAQTQYQSRPTDQKHSFSEKQPSDGDT